MYSLNDRIVSKTLPSKTYEHVDRKIKDKAEINQKEDHHRNPEIPSIVTDPLVEGQEEEVEVDPTNDDTEDT